MEYSGFDLPNEDFRSHLSNRLLDARTIVINEAVTDRVAGALSEQVTVLEAESTDPIQVVMTSAPGGALDAGFAIYDLFRSVTAPLTILGSGRIVGAGVLAFVGASAARRFALPHARFRFEEPREQVPPGSARDVETRAKEAAERRDRVVTILAEETGQSSDQIESDLSTERSFSADEATTYGLIDQVVLSRSELDE